MTTNLTSNKLLLCKITSQELGALSDINNMPTIIKQTQMKSVLQGQTLKVGYAHFPPWSIIESQEPLKLSGIYVDVINTFAQEANVTIEYVSPKLENQGVWAKR